MNKHEKRAKLLKQMRAFSDAHPEMNDDQVSEYTALEKDYDGVDASIKREDALAAHETALSQPTTTPLSSVAATALTENDDYQTAFDAYLAGGDLNEIKAAMTETVKNSVSATISNT